MGLVYDEWLVFNGYFIVNCAGECPDLKWKGINCSFGDELDECEDHPIRIFVVDWVTSWGDILVLVWL